jgi:polyisoprenoid-binding protein YceI
MKKILLSLAAAAFSLASFAQTNWSGDNSHSSIMFAATHLTIGKTMGWFSEYDVKMTSSKEDFSDAQVEITIQTKSINTGNEGRDKHLQGDDFFAVEKNPTITFKSTSFKKSKGNIYIIKGNLTMKGVTKEVTFEGVYNGTKADPYGNTKAGWSIRGKVNRADYGVNWNADLKDGGKAVDEVVEIMCEFELKKN